MKTNFVVAILCICSLWTELHGQPRLKMSTGTKFSFGDIFLASKVQKSIALRNTGKDTLEISNVTATCGCTATMLSNNRIAPRDSGMLSITFDASRFSGEVEKGITFHTNDPKQEVVSINFNANIIRVLELDPEYLMFAHAVVDSPITTEITIKNIGTRPIKLLSVKSTSDIISAKLSANVVEPNQEVQLECTLNAKTAGSHKGYVEIKTDHPKFKTHGIRFFAYVKDNRQSKSTNNH